MAQKVVVSLVDDLDSSEADETVEFGLDGATYEIDLSDANAATLRDRLAGDAERVVHVRGDRDASYGEIVAVIDLLAGGGITRIALVSRPNGPATTASVAETIR